ncbi:MAG: hypothetical protein K6F33_10370, partial [Bacteroidales bacterium]|nr:hypothetical protein [Bacteroidales bacterium]
MEKCPIFREGTLLNEKTGETYKTVYCMTERYKQCKRYLVSQKCTLPIPVQVLPNASIPVDEIVKRIENGFYDIFNKKK